MFRSFRRFHSSSRRYLSSYSSLIDIKPNILTALRSHRPVVALESTIITHGMPYPHNLETAAEVEEIIRQENAIPATIAILNGRIKVGLSPEELVVLARPDNQQSVKVSRRDMAYVVSNQMNGGTTVAGTLIIANMVGINVFATGGIGGVHRDGNVTMDVSADLVELGRNPVAVVASGVKSILDIPKTLEFLETQGVCVASYQSSNKDFPAFYTRKSGSTAPYNFASPSEAAEVINGNLNLGLRSGILIAAPVPEEWAMNEDEINLAIKNALELAETNDIRGKEITPFLLSKIAEITKGRSLDTNIALIKNNAKIAAQIAVELAKLKASTQPEKKCEIKSSAGNDFVVSDRSNKVPVVVGASVIDLSYTIADDDLKFNGATYHSKLQTFGGGVGRNIAEAISKLYGCVHFISVVGNDQNGDYLKTLLPPDCRRYVVTSEAKSTASFILILDRSGDCKLIVGNTEINNYITPELIIKNEKIIQRAPVVVFDANINLDCIGTILELCSKYNVPAFFEPTDMRKAHIPFELPYTLIKQIKFISPNIHELNVIAKCLRYEDDYPDPTADNYVSDKKLFASLMRVTKFVNEKIENVIVTMGPIGILIARRGNAKDSVYDQNGRYVPELCTNERQFHLYETKRIEEIVNVSGAGDSWTSGFVSAMVQGLPEDVCVSVGFEASKRALMSSSPVATEYFDQNNSCWSNGAEVKNF
ncbi:pseudouridine-metabolizing bifunctional protein C1861.05 [Bradysia coprophila]|uniref:pseudouridine-metabolizing bifunctional protein C1861.05 n=1 Tax=Bradysia coprophila TaxID=38358 RepID=UPI00187D8F0B|nr:pseudouridine-metabolizing bifunctional protein C1861.05 [Bradysia coprophila]